MRTLFLMLLVALAEPTSSEIRSPGGCNAAVAADPAAAREEAAVWERLGGGVPARLCEAEALAALGAHATDTRLLTGLGGNPIRAIESELRAVVLEDGAGQLVAAGRPDLTRVMLSQADRLKSAGASRVLLRARAEAGDADWTAAAEALAAMPTRRWTRLSGRWRWRRTCRRRSSRPPSSGCGCSSATVSTTSPRPRRGTCRCRRG